MNFAAPEVAAAMVAGAVALVVGFVTSAITVASAERKLRRDFQLEFAAEAVARALMSDRDWTLRSFDIIKHHLAGFEDNELRKVLVRAGAVRFDSQSGKELWGLLERNRDLLGAERLNMEPGERYEGPRPKGGGGGGSGVDWRGRPRMVQDLRRDV